MINLMILLIVKSLFQWIIAMKYNFLKLIFLPSLYFQAFQLLLCFNRTWTSW